jgi:hypothetical protein
MPAPAIAQKDRARSAQHQEAVPPEGYRPRSRRYDFFSPCGVAAAASSRIRRTRIHAEGQSQDVPRRLAAILSQLGSRRRLVVIDELFAIEAPKTRCSRRS